MSKGSRRERELVEQIDPDAACLFSGGRDSLVTTHKMMESGEADIVVHCDTGSGLPQNLEYVEEVCESHGWPLAITEPKLTLGEFARRYGFPKAQAHLWAMRYFKEHPISAFASEYDCRVFYSGVYRHESDTRYTRVDGDATDRGTFEYRSPCHNWRDHQFEEYIDEHGLKRNPHAERLGRSPDCYCLAVGHRDEVIIDLREHGYDDHADRLLDLEKQVQDLIGTQEEYCWLGSQGMCKKELRSLMAQEDDEQAYLCGEGCYTDV